MKLKNKILIIISIFISALFLAGSSSSVLAATQNVDSITIPVDNSEIVITNPFILDYENILVLHWYQTSVGVNHFQVYFSNEGAFGFYYKANKEFSVTCVNENLEHVPFYYVSAAYNNIKTSENFFNTCTLDDATSLKTQSYRDSLYSSIDNIAYAKYDVLTYDFTSSIASSDISKESSTGYGSFFTLLEPSIVNPQFVTTVEELQTGKIDSLVIKANDFNNYERITLSIAEVNRPISDDTEIIYHNNMKSYDLYSIATFNDFTHFVVDYNKLNYGFENGKEYIIYMTSGTTFNNSYGYLKPDDEILDVLYFTVGGLTEEEILQEKQDITNGLLEEQNETNKGIWGTIKEILSYLNPFSENFFAYKLVELILDGLKSLFIPEDGFFETFFEDMKNWFSERLGFLFYPFELIIDILNKMLNINFTEPIFNIPDIKEPFTDTKLISATTYNLNNMLSNSTLENMHNIYLVVVDAIIIFALVNLAKRKFEEVTDK